MLIYISISAQSNIINSEERAILFSKGFWSLWNHKTIAIRNFIRQREYSIHFLENIKNKRQ